MSNLAQRLITGSIFVVVLVGCIWWSPWSMFILMLAIGVLGLNEFYNLSEKAGASPQKYFGIVIGFLTICTAFFVRAGHIIGLLEFALIPLLFTIFFVELWRKKDNPFANIAWTVIGLIYIIVPLSWLTWTFTPKAFLIDYPAIQKMIPPYSGIELLTFFILIWVSDSMAYVCGRLFGKNKLWERISPKKTQEGFVGGLIFTVITGLGLGYYWLTDNNVTFAFMWALIGLVISVTGMFGDLVESLFKRSINVKDSGTILPGHGGILDRFDALFLATPFALTVYWLYTAIATTNR
jgi:phosphatidate cytidylyltransferase